MYVPQRPSLLPGTPRDFLQRLSGFSACKARMQRKHNGFTTPSASLADLQGRSIQIAEEWGIDDSLWDRPWPTLSGGEAQRISLATAVGLNCSEILLLDGIYLIIFSYRVYILTISIQNRHLRWTPKQAPL